MVISAPFTRIGLFPGLLRLLSLVIEIVTLIRVIVGYFHEVYPWYPWYWELLRIDLVSLLARYLLHIVLPSVVFIA